MRDNSEVEPFYAIAVVLRGNVACHGCKKSVTFTSAHPDGTNERYHDLAAAMQAERWVVRRRHMKAWCRACATKRGIPDE